MNFLQRLGFFSIGLIMGIGILMFFLGGKKASCDYSPNARTLKNIRIKERVISDEALGFFQSNNIDTSFISTVLDGWNVDFGKSETDRKPCKIYFITEEYKENEFELQIENCENKAFIQLIKRVEK